MSLFEFEKNKKVKIKTFPLPLLAHPAFSSLSLFFFFFLPQNQLCPTTATALLPSSSPAQLSFFLSSSHHNPLPSFPPKMAAIITPLQSPLRPFTLHPRFSLSLLPTCASSVPPLGPCKARCLVPGVRFSSPPTASNDAAPKLTAPPLGADECPHQSSTSSDSSQPLLSRASHHHHLL